MIQPTPPLHRRHPSLRARVQWSVSTSVLNRIVAGLDLDHHLPTLRSHLIPATRLDNEHTEDGANPILRSEQPFPRAAMDSMYQRFLPPTRNPFVHLEWSDQGWTLSPHGIADESVHDAWFRPHHFHCCKGRSFSVNHCRSRLKVQSRSSAQRVHVLLRILQQNHLKLTPNA